MRDQLLHTRLFRYYTTYSTSSSLSLRRFPFTLLILPLSAGASSLSSSETLSTSQSVPKFLNSAHCYRSYGIASPNGFCSFVRPVSGAFLNATRCLYSCDSINPRICFPGRICDRFRLFSNYCTSSPEEPELGKCGFEVASSGVANTGSQPGSPSGIIDDIVDVIARNQSDMESQLNSTGTVLSEEQNAIEVFGVLNRKCLPGTRFFQWISNTHPSLSCNSCICSLMVDNCGRTGDYNAMLIQLRDMAPRGILLTCDAFGYLSGLSSTNVEKKRLIERLLGILKEAGASAFESRIRILVKTLCDTDSYEMAKFVVEITKKELADYNMLIRECCSGRQLQGARAVLAEMRQNDLDPDVRMYNYLVSCFCKYGSSDEACGVIKEMVERGCLPNALTYDILICDRCRAGDLEGAINLYGAMICDDIQPRLSTHAAIIKGYFDLRKYLTAHNFVINASAILKSSANKNYSLLASLHQKRGNLYVAYNIILEMMDKGLKPDNGVYLKVRRRLLLRRKDFAKALESRFNSFVHQSSSNKKQ